MDLDVFYADLLIIAKGAIRLANVQSAKLTISLTQILHPDAV